MSTIFPLIGTLAALVVFPQLTQADQGAPQSTPPKKTQSKPLFSQGDASLDMAVPQGSNFPAAVALEESCHLSLTASYLYWFAGEGGLDLATTASYDSGSNMVFASPEQTKTIFQDFDYNSGFKVGVGYSIHRDSWVVRADYTRLHQATSTKASADVDDGDVLFVTNWFYQTALPGGGQNIAAGNLSSRWHLELDWLDVSLQRPLYSGRSLSLTPFMGLRTSWIEQSLNLYARNAVNFNPPTDSVHSRNRQRSWAIGPRFGVDAHYLLGAGVRIQGEVGGSLLFTQFSKVTHSEDPIVAGGTAVSYAFHNFNCVRPMAEANLGMGWGMYFSRNRYHIDLSATYDFNYLWSQNMIRVLNDLNMSRTNAAANDLYLHGLTATATFSF